MDKFTVDLDQVLNDFEYSELTTDHYNNEQLVVSSKNGNHHNGESSIHSNSNTTKHSITNVFNSLTEYLNTEITPKSNNTQIFHQENNAITSSAAIVNYLESNVDRETEVETIEENEPDNNVESNLLLEITTDVTENETELIKINSEPPPSYNLNNSNTMEISSEYLTPDEIPNDFPETTDAIPEEVSEIDPDSDDTKVKIPVDSVDDSNQLDDDSKTNKITTPIGFVDDLNLDDSEINQAFADLEEELESHVTSKDENNTEVKEDVCLRPQNLAVVNNEQKREINLIGDPGSTPYNNVYINKEISGSSSGSKNNKMHDSDTDYSTSESPTFSEDSSETGSVSTASTEAVIDDDLDKDSVPKVEEQIPESNAECVDENNGSNSSETVAVENEVLDEMEEGASACLPVAVEGTGDATSLTIGPDNWLGKQAPLWIPDSEALSCLHCDMKFTVLKRRHHCRACGLVLCSKCCNLRFRLDYLDQEARVCKKCFDILNKDTVSNSSSSELSPDLGNSPTHRPNPNNPLEYCSTVSPLQQVDPNNQNPPAVMVPVGVLKREGSTKTRSNKSVIFCDGIRPGSDLTNLDTDFNYNHNKLKSDKRVVNLNKNLPNMDEETKSFIPSNQNMLPPVVTVFKTDITYADCSNDLNTIEILKNDMLTFALHLNLYVHLKVINMDCCVNKIAWCFSTEGLINVGQDEIVILLEFIEEESTVPKDVFLHLNNIYCDAVKGTSVKETGVSLHNNSMFLDSKNHAGFVYIRPTFECLRKVIVPKESYLIGILIHRWETPWAKLFPLRLILRLGAEYRYYPSPIISTRHRDSVFVEIGHTIINLLADFRNFSYTLPQIRGLTIHMEDKNTTINIPINRYDQVMKSISNSSDHILAFAGNFSLLADSHLVCIQETQGNENNYTTHAINIHNKPRKVTGASFIVFNGALKSSSGLTAKSNIVEDGLMIQVLPEHMLQIRESLRNMKNHTIQCGCVNATSDETVHITWGENDVNFNIGVVSPIDNKSMSGIPSIRVHNGKDYICYSKNRLIRWTEVFIIQNGEENSPNNSKNQDPVDISKVSESIAKAACNALVKYLDLLVSNNFYKIAIRTTLDVEMVSYAAGSNTMKLPPIYMKSLDNELIPVLHRIASNNFGDNAVVLELILRILNL